jgi:phosphoadenosine phosphosulfate reductase
MGREAQMSAITLYATPSDDYEGKLAHTLAVLQSAASEYAGAIVQSTSMGAEDMVVTDLIAGNHLRIDIATLDTGELPPETLELIERIEPHYGVPVQVYRPAQEQVIRFVDRNGPRAMYDSIDLRKACCALRKLEPLSRMLADKRAWVTGLRREQSDHRGGVPFQDTDAQGRLKLNPLADWTWGDVWHYIAANDVPYNALHDEFYPSIGCAPCTRAISVGEPFRAGRWWWEDEAAKECGLHVKNEQGAAA